MQLFRFISYKFEAACCDVLNFQILRMYDGIVAARVSGSVQSLRRTSMMERVGTYRYTTS